MAEESVPKFQYLSLIIPTVEVNHTALFKTEKLPKDYFSRLFYTKPGNYAKDRSSREHDEVIDLSAKALGMKVQFLEKRTNKGRDITRYAIFYIKFSPREPEAFKQAQTTMHEFIKHYRRHDREYPMAIVTRLSEIKI